MLQKTIKRIEKGGRELQGPVSFIFYEGITFSLSLSPVNARHEQHISSLPPAFLSAIRRLDSVDAEASRGEECALAFSFPTTDDKGPSRTDPIMWTTNIFRLRDTWICCIESMWCYCGQNRISQNDGWTSGRGEKILSKGEKSMTAKKSFERGRTVVQE